MLLANTEAALEIKTIQPPLFRVLIADGIAERSNSFRMASSSSNKPSFLFRIVKTADDLSRSLQNDKWDVLMHFLYLGRGIMPMDTLPDVVKAFEAGTLRGVLVTTSVSDVGIHFTRMLREMGVPAKFFPYSYATPAVHNEFQVATRLLCAGGVKQ